MTKAFRIESDPSLGKVFLKYLFSGIGSAVMVSVYSIVDCIMVGQYEGADGMAALAVITPVWTIIISLGLLFGVGGSVIFAKLRGEGDKRSADEIFTITMMGVAVVAAIAWAAIAFGDAALLKLAGANDAILPLAQRYLKWLKFVVPLFTLGQVLAAFLRNDGAPALAMIATVSGGLFNIAGDYLLVFVADMGIEGAGLSTGIGQTLAFCIMCSHFFSKRNTLRLVKPRNFFPRLAKIAATGFPSFVVDIAVGLLSIVFNNQIMKYLGETELAVYGVIININLVAQYMSYGVGQAIQPIVSRSYGAGEHTPIRKTTLYGAISAGAVAALFLALCEAAPMPIMRIFISDITSDIEAVAPTAVRIYSLSYIFLPLNIFVTYYLQSIMKARASFAISLLRGFVLSSLFAFVFPLGSPDALWWATFAAEAATFGVSAAMFVVYSRKLKTSLSPAAREEQNAPPQRGRGA